MLALVLLLDVIARLRVVVVVTVGDRLARETEYDALVLAVAVFGLVALPLGLRECDALAARLALADAERVGVDGRLALAVREGDLDGEAATQGKENSIMSAGAKVVLPF